MDAAPQRRDAPPSDASRPFPEGDALLPGARPPPRGARGKPPVDDCWAGQSLGDALLSKKAAAPPTASSSTAPSRGAPPSGGGGGGGGGAPGAGDCEKSPQDIVVWVKSLPESHVPMKTREHLASLVEEQGMDGRQWSQYVLTVPPEICAPKHAMKLKAAWSNVLKESEARKVALENLNNAPQKKATMIVI
mmetsp:Transcript_18417/g.39359  ORF Transcript_18417/g.39359 Transcript_18417/m.39359 type:complete len:191 (+) Transcript_18417:601-1173(+)